MFQGPGLAKPGCDVQIIQIAAREKVLAGWVQQYPLPADLGVSNSGFRAMWHLLLAFLDRNLLVQ